MRDTPEAEMIVQCVLAFILMALSLCCLTGLYHCIYCVLFQKPSERAHLQVHANDLQLSTHSALYLTVFYGDIFSFKAMTESLFHQIMGSPPQVWENCLALSNLFGSEA